MSLDIRLRSRLYQVDAATACPGVDMVHAMTAHMMEEVGRRSRHTKGRISPHPRRD